MIRLFVRPSVLFFCLPSTVRYVAKSFGIIIIIITFKYIYIHIQLETVTSEKGHARR